MSNLCQRRVVGDPSCLFVVLLTPSNIPFWGVSRLDVSSLDSLDSGSADPRSDYLVVGGRTS